MAEVSGGGVAHAVRAGIARVSSAPAVLAGTLALTLVFALSSSRAIVSPYFDAVFALNGSLLSQCLAVLPLSLVGEIKALWQLGNPLYAPYVIHALVVWSFLAGGILDRYARNRPTRGRGFFGACGAHFPALLRLGIMEWLLLFGLMQYQERHGYRAGYGAMVIVLAAGLLFLCARVRLVVEDRRSAIGAVLAGARFIRRNPAAVPIYLIFAAALWGSARLLLPVLDVEARLMNEGAGQLPTLLSFAARELVVAFILFLTFASWASALALFQARLAHASYTAGPPLEWPESPAAEAITNLSSSPIA